MRQETFVNYRGYRWFWINLLAISVLTLVYIFDSPIGGASGGSVLGYTYGILAALGIFYLMWFGIRKRSYYSSGSTLKGCLAAHIWLGLALVLLVPLHSGFSFGYNVHTLAYVLMLLTVFSGVWGAVNYSRLAPQIQSNRGGASVKVLLQQIVAIDDDIEALIKSKSDALINLSQKINFKYSPSISSCLSGADKNAIDHSEAADLLSSLEDSEKDDGFSLIEMVNRKAGLCNKVGDEVRVSTWLKLWLFIHVPLSFACLVTLLIHIVSVFYYW